ncbi:unnamed protein product, partial [Iphiclides podalirius]
MSPKPGRPRYAIMSILRRGDELVAEYVARAERLAPLFPRLHTVRARPLPECRLGYEHSPNLALELSRSMLYEPGDSVESAGGDSLWNGRPQQYFESMNYGKGGDGPTDDPPERDFESDSLAQ